jgi:LPXTG-motif cell wall-anchored protein
VFTGEGENGLDVLKYTLAQQYIANKNNEFVYYVKEVVPAGLNTTTHRKDDIVYDTQMFMVIVKPVDNGDGTMTATPEYYEQAGNTWRKMNLDQGTYATFTNEQLYLLEVKKIVTGSSNSDTRFNFTITLTKDGAPYTVPITESDLIKNDQISDIADVQWTKTGDGVYTFTLASKESIQFYLHDGVKYQIVEKADGYSTYIQVGYAQGTRANQPAEYDKIVEDTILVATGKHTVTYTNTPGTILPKTGGSGTLPYTAAGLGMISAAIGYGMYLHKKKKEEDPEGSESM